MTELQNACFEDWEREQLDDPQVRAALEELEPAYQVTRLRLLRGLTQKQLAQRVGTHQSSVARLESGKVQPSVSFLRRVANALGAKLDIKLTSREDNRSKSLIPENLSNQSAHGQITINLGPRLYEELANLAQEQNIGVHQFIIMLLSEGKEREQNQVYLTTQNIQVPGLMYSENKGTESRFIVVTTPAGRSIGRQ